MEQEKLKAEIKKISSAIYKAYYEQNPKGDARFGLWGEVLRAEEEVDPIAALKKILKRYTK
jgi:hypothetical protein